MTQRYNHAITVINECRPVNKLANFIHNSNRKGLRTSTQTSPTVSSEERKRTTGRMTPSTVLFRWRLIWLIHGSEDLYTALTAATT
ncbi:hypothetical protein TNCT_174681 [Trichonephila clavata]|uniref:Uncharacterized protein n=1 Tax=Trichonephila clavata TaxID=2740835 RepID=A0A8X6F122_TRICU|nr:hypothetical protein TNCT_174681 [Trichonephila clavata]